MKRNIRRSLLAIFGLLTVGVIAAPVSITQAGYIDSVHADAALITEKFQAVRYSGQNTLAASSGAVVGSDGSVWVTGYRPRSDNLTLQWAGGYAGTGSDADLTTSKPVPVSGFGVDGKKAVSVAAASKTGSSSLSQAFAALTDDGRVFAWGSNYGGLQNVQNANSKYQLTPKEIEIKNGAGAKQKVVDLQAAHQQFFALTESGEMYVWGYSGWQTSSGNNVPDFGSGHILSTNKTARENNVATWGVPTLFNSKFFDKYIVPFETTTCGEHPTGGVISAYNPVAPSTRIHMMNISSRGGLFVTQTGVVYSWGYNTFGVGSFYAKSRDFAAQKTAFETFKQMDCPRVAFGVNNVVAETYTGEQLALGCSGTVGAVNRVSDACPIRQLGSRDRANQMVLQNGDMYTWGTGRLGALDTRKYLGRTPSALGANHPLYTVLEWEGPVQEWPSANAQENDADYPVKISSVSATGNPDEITTLANLGLGVLQVANGLDHTLLLMTDGSVYGYGSDSFCQSTGIADASGGGTCKSRTVTPVPTLNTTLKSAGKATGIAAGTCWSYATTEDGRLFGWGGRYASGSYDVASETQACVAANSSGLTAYGDHLPTSAGGDPYGDKNNARNVRIPTIELAWKW